MFGLNGTRAIDQLAQSGITRGATGGKWGYFLSPDGNAWFGSDIGDPRDANTAKPDTTSFSIFSAAKTWNGESLGSGDVIFGSNSSGYANILWDASAKQLKFRNGTATTVYVDTTGVLTFDDSSADSRMRFQLSADATRYYEFYVDTGIEGQAFHLASDTSAATKDFKILISNTSRSVAEEFIVATGTGTQYVVTVGGFSATSHFGVYDGLPAPDFRVYPNQVLGLTVNTTGLYIGDQSANYLSGTSSALKANGKWLMTNQPMARVYNNAALSVPNNTDTALTFNSERYDTDTIHDTGSNTSRLTCKTAGKYRITGSISFASNATGYRYAYIRLNGTTPISAGISINAVSGYDSMLSPTTTYQLAVNDYVELMVGQTSGGPLNVNVGGNYTPEFMMEYVGD